MISTFLLSVSELNVEIVHKAGKKIPATDFFSPTGSKSACLARILDFDFDLDLDFSQVLLHYLDHHSQLHHQCQMDIGFLE